MYSACCITIVLIWYRGLRDTVEPNPECLSASVSAPFPMAIVLTWQSYAIWGVIPGRGNLVGVCCWWWLFWLVWAAFRACVNPCSHSQLFAGVDKICTSSHCRCLACLCVSFWRQYIDLLALPQQSVGSWPDECFWLVWFKQIFSFHPW